MTVKVDNQTLIFRLLYERIFSAKTAADLHAVWRENQPLIRRMRKEYMETLIDAKDNMRMEFDEEAEDKWRRVGVVLNIVSELEKLREKRNNASEKHEGS